MLRKQKQVRQYEFESDHLIKLLGISEDEKTTKISLGNVFVLGRINPITILLTTEKEIA